MRRQKSPPRKKSSNNYQVRVIGGQWKRSLLPVSAVPDLRPTPSRVRETLFNWLSHIFDGNWDGMLCLDLFAGTGAFGFEAASRGARHVVMVESHRTAFAQLQATRDKFNATQLIDLLQGDALQVAERLVSQKKQFDVIFLDPPFQANVLSEVLPLCAQLLKKDGLVYVELPSALNEETLKQIEQIDGQWHIIRQDRAGHVCYHLLRLQD